MVGKDFLTIFYEQLTKFLRESENDFSFAPYFYNSYLAGNRTIYQKYLSETKKFDDEWITTLESYFPSIAKIIQNPRSALLYEEDVVMIEKARKISARSIRHLSSNTHLIKDVKGDQVIPKKILVSQAEQYFGIYENRFIMTLINRLYTFVINRFQVIHENVESFRRDHLNFSSQFEIDEQLVTLNLDLVIKKDLENQEINEHNKNLLKRVEHLRNLIFGFKNSPFMDLLKSCKEVRPPILKTNIIIKNPDFKNAYNLWLFLDQYNSLGYDVDVEEKDLPVDNSYQKDIDYLSMMFYLLMMGNQTKRTPIYNAIPLTKYTKKSTKVAKTHPHDMVNNPDEIIMEDYSLNEFYLDKIKQVFEENLETISKENILPETALRRALRQTIDITNALYQGVFDFEEEKDVFRRMVKEDNPVADLEQAKEKAKVAKIVRETKEVDYNNSIRLERRLVKEIEKLNIRVIRIETKKKYAQQKAELKEQFIKEREQEKQLMIEKHQELTQELKRVNEAKLKLLEEERLINKRIKETAEKIALAEKERWEKEKTKMIAKEKAEREVIRQKQLTMIEKDKQKRMIQYEKAKDILNLKQQQIKEKLKDKRRHSKKDK